MAQKKDKLNMRGCDHFDEFNFNARRKCGRDKPIYNAYYQFGR